MSRGMKVYFHMKLLVVLVNSLRIAPTDAYNHR